MNPLFEFWLARRAGTFVSLIRDGTSGRASICDAEVAESSAA
jgi:hypothetical protein